MKRILISLSIIGIAAGAVAGGTIAFFNDTETSTGNIFVAGTIDLTIDSNGSSLNGVGLADTNFLSTDLTDEKFFVFDDIKPGDFGVRDISVHVSDNPAYACLLIHNKVDVDNGITDPEDEVDNVNDNADGTADGDLSRDLELFAWEDLNADQTYDPGTGEPPLTHDGGGFDPDSFFDITFEIMFDSLVMEQAWAIFPKLIYSPRIYRSTQSRSETILILSVQRLCCNRHLFWNA